MEIGGWRIGRVGVGGVGGDYNDMGTVSERCARESGHEVGAR